MSIDWKAFERDVQQNVARASGEADQSLAAQIAAQLKLTQEEVEVMFPRPEDLQALTRLVGIVKGATARHEKIQRIVDESEALSGVIVKLLNKLI